MSHFTHLSLRLAEIDHVWPKSTVKQRTTLELHGTDDDDDDDDKNNVSFFSRKSRSPRSLEVSEK
jgi:hypothetical protein